MERVGLIVIGAGPYGVAVAAQALERGVDTVVLGRPMSFWTDNMPAGMFLRSGPDWHLDASGVHTFAAYLEEVGLAAEEIDPIPVSVFLGYAAWFQERTKVQARAQMARRITVSESGYTVTLDDGGSIHAEAVVAAPGPGPFTQLPAWASGIPPEIGAHTCDVVDFRQFGGARVLVVGGRQSAYEWAALIAEAGAERVDIVHRHPEPGFGRVSWQFVEPYMKSTGAEPGWWRSLSPATQEDIAREFWQAGRLTLEWWLSPRLEKEAIHRWPDTSVVDVEVSNDGSCQLTLSGGQRLSTDRVVFATGYRAAFENVGYLTDVQSGIAVVDGYPVLDEAFQTTLPGLYAPGFLSTRDFGPFFGFTRGCPVAAALIVEDLLRRP